jgi:hypothetical protein
MVNDVRNYSSTTREMSLLGACDTSAESVSLDSLQGLPTPPFTLILSAGTTSEEVVLATEISGSIVTIVRAQGGTTARSHTAGASVIHGLFGGDLQDFQDHVQATTAVHGTAGALVDTTSEQELTNKTISGADNTITGLNGATALTDASVTNAKLGANIDADTLNNHKWTPSATAPPSPSVNDVWVDIS